MTPPQQEVSPTCCECGVALIDVQRVYQESPPFCSLGCYMDYHGLNGNLRHQDEDADP